MFYLLKSEFKRNFMGDVMIDLDKVESVHILNKKFTDTENPLFKLAVRLGSGDHFMAVFLTIENAKKVMKEILGSRIDNDSLEEYQAEIAERK